MLATAYGPQEPERTRIARDHYWARRIWLATLEGRIQMTDSGLEWLMRLRRIGHHA